VNTLPDEELVRAYLNGDPGAFDALVTRYQQRVYAVALRMCGDPEDARDATQNALISALRNLRSFRAEAKLSTWLHRLAVNASLDVIRRRRPSASLEELSDRRSEGTSPEESAVTADRARSVHRALAALSPEHRAVVVLHDLQQQDYAEVAEILDIPVGTVKSRIHRARIELAKLLGHLREGEPMAGEAPLI
jgi:RNA polymerase sigma-70 factor (ECF subfamily)